VSSTTDKPTADAAAEMQIEWDVPIPMDDGVVLRADVFRPVADPAAPVLLSYGPYGKNLSFQEGYPMQWTSMVDAYPDVAAGSSNRYQAWEVADPEKWVPHGYAVVRVDSRGAGRSPGYIDCFTPRETRDLYDCIAWAGTREWSNGKVGLSGISYYAVNQWQVAALHPPHLAAICPWEGAADWYRDAGHHGGVPSPFLGRWFPHQVGTVQHGLGPRGGRHPDTGILVAGDAELSDEQLAANRGDIMTELREHPFADEYWTERTGDLAQITTPLLSAGNWGGQGLHLRGNIEGYVQAASTQKWLEIHGGAHWALYYTDYGVTLQRRFFDWFLKGEGDWDQQPPILLNIRRPGEESAPRAEREWPLARTEWTKLYLDPASGTLAQDPQGDSDATYRAFGTGLTLLAEPFDRETEITGPVAAKLWISSSTEDTDVFLVVHLFKPNGEEVLFHGATEPKQPISQGWLRASHRKLDADRTRPWAPFHPHREQEPLERGEIYELDVEIWPTCIVAPAGYRLGLSVLGRDYDHGLEGTPSHLGYELRGCGLNVHDDPVTRPADVYDGEVTVYGGGDHPSHLLIPVIPEQRS
jgi:predicted acyl esterase